MFLWSISSSNSTSCHGMLDADVDYHGRFSMMANAIVPDRVTKPIQLLAAWLVGLILVNGSFLVAAEKIRTPAWVAAVLVIAAVVNVPVFLGALFLLQTKFRAQMQDDPHYSKFLEFEKQAPPVNQEAVMQAQIESVVEKISSSLNFKREDEQRVSEILRQAQVDVLVAKHGGKRTISELYLARSTWNHLLKKSVDNASFIRTTDALIEDGLIEVADGYKDGRLTDLGMKVAIAAEEKSLLFSQIRADRWAITRKQIAELIDEP